MCMFLVLTGMPVTVQAADYDGGTGSAEKTQETYLKTFLEDLDFAELDTWTKEELFPEQREKFSFSVMVQELLADGIGVTSMEKIGQWLCDALLYEIKTGKTILVEVVLLAAGFSMLKNFSGTFEKNYVSDICFLLVYGVLCVLLHELSVIRRAVLTAVTESLEIWRMIKGLLFLHNFCFLTFQPIRALSLCAKFQLEFWDLFYLPNDAYNHFAGYLAS